MILQEGLKGFPGELGVEDGGWGLGRDVPGGTRGAAGTQGSPSMCPAPAPGCCMCPKPALDPQVPERGRHRVSMHMYQIFPHSIFPALEEEGSPGVRVYMDYHSQWPPCLDYWEPRSLYGTRHSNELLR